MPVIDPLRLQQQIDQCFSNKEATELFVNGIKELLETYSDHAFRAGELATLPSTLKSYHVPQPLLRILKKELAVLSRSNVHQSLKIAEELWKQPFRECKDLAISILKNLPLEMEKEVFHTTEHWISNCMYPDLIESVAQHALKTICLQNPVSLITQVQKWIVDERHNMQRFGFLVLEQISLSISFGDLPLLFKVISPYLHRCPTPFFQNMVSICQNLIEKSPKEMAYLMRTAINQNPAADAKKLIKACLRSFPSEFQAELTAITNR